LNLKKQGRHLFGSQGRGGNEMERFVVTVSGLAESGPSGCLLDAAQQEDFLEIDNPA